MPMYPLAAPDVPVFAVPEATLVPVSAHLAQMAPIPPSRMFLINKSLKSYIEKYPNSPTFDASQGDGGASLPGVPMDPGKAIRPKPTTYPNNRGPKSRTGFTASIVSGPPTPTIAVTVSPMKIGPS